MPTILNKAETVLKRNRRKSQTVLGLNAICYRRSEKSIFFNEESVKNQRRPSKIKEPFVIKPTQLAKININRKGRALTNYINPKKTNLTRNSHKFNIRKSKKENTVTRHSKKFIDNFFIRQSEIKNISLKSIYSTHLNRAKDIFSNFSRKDAEIITCWSKVITTTKLIVRLSTLSQELKIFGISSRENYEIASIKNSCIIHPNSGFLKNWTYVLIFLLIYTATIMVFRICFEDITTNGWLVLDICVDILFLVDVILNFYMGYYDIHGYLIIEKKKIAMQYLKSWFTIDMIALIPDVFGILLQELKILVLIPG